MIWPIALAVVLWLAGWVLDWPVARRWAMVAGVWAATVLAHLVLPADHPFRQATGGDLRSWVVLGGAGGLVWAYVAGLGALKARAVPAAKSDTGPYAPGEVDRYARHLFLREIGGPGQRRLKEARVLVVGAGGLGAPVLLYLAAAGVGRITVIDPDRVEAANLQRQIIHADARIGMAKAQSAALALRALNPFAAVEPVVARLDEANGPALIAAHDLVLDGTDNFDSRSVVNRLCVAAGRPLIMGALSQWEGQVSLFDPARGGPCYDCIFPVRPAPGSVPSCAEAGVAGPLPGIIGSIMAVEAVKHLTGAGETLRGRLMIHDALFADSRVISARPRPGCPVCGHLQG
ncbi:MAG: HesA/MoeB/ThiF family protein [Paracoccaceae bacterium]